MKKEQVKRFFAYARERYQVYLNRLAGYGWPWTNDTILQTYRFCNVFREDDTVTRWIRQRFNKKHYPEPAMLLANVIAARWFNYIPTLEILEKSNFFDTHDTGEAERRLWNQVPVTNAAYIISSPGGKRKASGILWCIDRVFVDVEELADKIKVGTTLEKFHGLLVPYPWLGDFMAYEIVTDLRHSLLRKAPDILTWANPGPGAKRGWGRIELGEPYKYIQPRFSADSHPDGVYGKVGKELVIQGMRKLLEASRDDANWSLMWPAWEMREVEHTLCEFDKYERVRLGEGRPKQLYRRN